MENDNQANLSIVTNPSNPLFEVVADIHTKGMVYDESNHEDFIRTIAIGCNLAGITRAEAKRLIAERCNLQESVVSATVYAVYREYVNDYAAKSLSYNMKLRANDDEEVWLKMPYLPDYVFTKLPQILQSAVLKFPDDKRERDVFFTGALAVLSGLFPWVHGVYRGKTVYPNLYCFVVAPAGSGKGSMIFAKELGIPFHNKDRRLFIPANISTAALYEELEITEGTGILFESEADTMSDAFKQDWGGYSTILRNAFQHESVSLKRKDFGKDRRYLEIPVPKLSVVLSGTKNQIKGIIPDAENGLFSRFLFYTFRSERVWKDDTDDDLSLDDFFKDLASEMLQIIENVRSIENFKFTDEQRQIFNARFSAWFNEIVLFFSEGSDGVIKRMAWMTFRIAMILSLMRKGSEDSNNGNENENANETTLYCKDIDFHLAFYLTATYIQHSLYMFEYLNTNKSNQSVGDRKLQLFFDKLPSGEFSRAEAVQMGNENMNLSERTVDKYLGKLRAAGYLIQDTYGKYMKN